MNIVRLIAASVMLTAAFCGVYAKDKAAPKKGWSFNPLPVCAYETDLGLQLGGMCDIYYYGDGTDFPEYRHKIFAEAYYSTKNSGVFYLYYDTEHLIPGVRLTASAAYIPEMMHGFYGFNGFSSKVYGDYDRNRSKKVAYYNIDFKLIKAFADFQGDIGKGFRWAAGVTYLDYRVGEVKLKPYAGSMYGSLYGDYLEAGLIREDEACGGRHIELKAGIVYDTRDHEAAPSRGIWAEAIVYGAPDMLSSGYNYMKAAFHFRHYVPLAKDRLVLAYHLAYQGTVAGEAPFYVQQGICSLLPSKPLMEGLGSSNTLRGVSYNRILGDGYAWGNLEFRVKLFDFNLLKQYWYVALNPFFDAGAVVRPYRAQEQKALAVKYAGDPRFLYPDGTSTLYSGSSDGIHCCAGIGGKIAMNYNLILSGEIGFPLDRRDGKYMLSLGMNYVF